MLKKILKTTLLGIFCFSLFFKLSDNINFTNSTAFATDTTVMVTEQIPGMDCTPEGEGTDVTTKKYKCTVKGGFQSVTDLLTGIIRYATFIVILLGVLVLVFSGIRLSVDGKKEKAIEQFKRVLIGLVVLFLLGFILNTVAPWVYK